MAINSVRARGTPQSVFGSSKKANPKVAAAAKQSAAAALKAKFPGVKNIKVSLPRDPFDKAPGSSQAAVTDHYGFVAWNATGTLNGKTVKLEGNFDAHNVKLGAR
jgi:hypothetical protein